MKTGYFPICVFLYFLQQSLAVIMCQVFTSLVKFISIIFLLLMHHKLPGSIQPWQDPGGTLRMNSIGEREDT